MNIVMEEGKRLWVFSSSMEKRKQEGIESLDQKSNIERRNFQRRHILLIY